MKTMYMHTINGSPAAYDGRQICYWWNGKKARMVNSLSEIRAQLRWSKNWRNKRGLSDAGFNYGYIRVSLP